MHGTQISDLGDAAELVGVDAVDRCEDGRHGVVDPDVDRAERFLDLGRGRLDAVGVGDVGRNRVRPSSQSLELALRRLEPLAAARDQPDRGALAGERTSSRTTDSRGGTGDDDDGHGQRAAAAAASTSRS